MPKPFIRALLYSFIQHASLRPPVCVELSAGRYWGPRAEHGSRSPALPGLTVQWGTQNPPQVVTTQSGPGGAGPGKPREGSGTPEEGLPGMGNQEGFREVGGAGLARPVNRSVSDHRQGHKEEVSQREREQTRFDSKDCKGFCWLMCKAGEEVTSSCRQRPGHVQSGLCPSRPRPGTG